MTQTPGFPPEGWYPNPGNPDQQRWWDGHQWTEHVAVGAPMAPGATPDNPATGPMPQQPAQQALPGQYQQPAQQQPYQQPYQQPAPQQYPQAYPQQPGYGAYPGYAPVTQRGVLPDGVRVAGWWWRVLARFLDGIVTTVPTLLIGLPWIRHVFDTLRDYVDQVNAADAAGTTIPTFDSGTITRDIVLLTLIGGLVAIVYEAVLLKLCSATVGKLICGLRVRCWPVRGPLPWSTVIKRVLSYQVLSAVPNIGGLYVLIDCLWPLWDKNRQALHDKLADTAVVHKRDADLTPQPASGLGGFGH